MPYEIRRTTSQFSTSTICLPAPEGDEVWVCTDGIFLRGGAGTVRSYAQVAEESYRGHSYGGPPNASVSLPGLLVRVLTFLRDNTGLLDRMQARGWIHGDANAIIYDRHAGFEPVVAEDFSQLTGVRADPLASPPGTILVEGGQGIAITAIQVASQSYETLWVRSVSVNLYSELGGDPYEWIPVYPPDHPIITSPNYGQVDPDGLSARITIDPVLVPPHTRAEVLIDLTSPSGRWGTIRQEIVPQEGS